MVENFDGARGFLHHPLMGAGWGSFGGRLSDQLCDLPYRALGLDHETSKIGIRLPRASESSYGSHGVQKGQGGEFNYL